LKRFIFNTLLYALLLLGLNILLGQYLRTFETIDLAGSGTFFPSQRWEGFYAAPAAPDVVILGSSHAYRSYEPNTLEAAFGGNTPVFNLGSSAQSPVTSYYVLEEAIRRKPPRLVIMDIYFMVFTSDEILNNGLANWNYMQAGPAKQAFFREGFSLKDQIATRFFPIYVYRKYLTGKIKKLMGRSYLPPGKGPYLEGGFVGFADTLSMEVLQNYNQFDRFQTGLSDFTEKNEAYLLRIARRCRELSIPLIFSVAPIPKVSVQKIKNYAEISAHFRQLAESVAVPYYDHNLQRLPQLLDTVHYYDDDHLNLAGAQLFSGAIGPVFKTEMQKQ
jgi:hypothetical protein